MRIALGLCLVILGCGGTDAGGTDAGGTDPAVCEPSGRFLELVEGHSWTYKVTDTMSHTVAMKTQTVGPKEAVAAHPGIMAFRLTTTKAGGSTTSWQEDIGTEIHRHAENDNSGGTTTTETYDPFRVRIDETAAHTATGATWSSSYTESVSSNGGAPVTADKVETWSVVADDEQVDVPAGRFCALHLRRTSTVGGVAGSTKDFWFVRDVGKVKETGEGQSEELTATSP